MINATVSKIYDDKTILLFYNNTYQEEMHYPLFDFADFTFILVFFVLPSIFSNATGSITIPDAENVPWSTIILYSALVAYMAVRYYTSNDTGIKGRKEKENGFNSKNLSPFFCGIANTVITAFCLLITNYIISKLALLISGSNAIPAINVTSSTTADMVFLVFWTILLACFEEFTYRYLLPTRLLSFCHDRRPEDKFTSFRKVLCEFAVICLFALAHRYMGWWAVANALIAGIILRTSFLKSGSIWSALIAHVLYNLTAFCGILKP